MRPQPLILCATLSALCSAGFTFAIMKSNRPAPEPIKKAIPIFVENTSIVGKWADYGGVYLNDVIMVRLLQIAKDGSYRQTVIMTEPNGRYDEDTGELIRAPSAEAERITTGKLDLSTGIETSSEEDDRIKSVVSFGVNKGFLYRTNNMGEMGTDTIRYSRILE